MTDSNVTAIADAKPTRSTATVSWATAIKPLIDHIIEQGKSSLNEIAENIGYTKGALQAWEREGRAPLRAKYALLGMASELPNKPQRTRIRLTHPELSNLFALAIGLDSSGR